MPAKDNDLAEHLTLITSAAAFVALNRYAEFFLHRIRLNRTIWPVLIYAKIDKDGAHNTISIKGLTIVGRVKRTEKKPMPNWKMYSEHHDLQRPSSNSDLFDEIN